MDSAARKKVRIWTRKSYRLDATKVERARRILGTRTGTETIQRALDLATENAALIRTLRNFVLKGAGHIDA
jgi:hypothetical protein